MGLRKAEGETHQLTEACDKRLTDSPVISNKHAIGRTHVTYMVLGKYRRAATRID